MQWLPHDVVDIIDSAIRQLDEDGFPIPRVEAICALILTCDPNSSAFLVGIRGYRAALRRTRPRDRLRGVPLVLRMPSPITLRLDGIVRSISRIEGRVYRHEVIGTLITGFGSATSLEEGCRAYNGAVAGDAAIPGELKRAVLSQERPRQGARL